MPAVQRVSRTVRLRRTIVGAVAIVGIAIAVTVTQGFGAFAAKPEITAVTAAVASVSGGDTVTIVGTKLQDVTAVTVAGVPATDVTIVSEAEVTAVLPRALDYQPATAQIEVLAADEKLPAASSLTVDYSVLTPVDAQMQYALAHWDRDDYNLAEYGTMNPIGGDCANFVGQSLMARGWTMTDEWYNRDAGAQWSYEWIHVPSFDGWLERNAAALGITRLPIEQRAEVKVGDIVMFDWDLNNSLDHTQIVSSIDMVDGERKIRMVGHNLDTDYRDLDEVITEAYPGAYVHFWSIPAA